MDCRSQFLYFYFKIYFIGYAFNNILYISSDVAIKKKLTPYIWKKTKMNKISFHRTLSISHRLAWFRNPSERGSTHEKRAFFYCLSIIMISISRINYLYIQSLLYNNVIMNRFVGCHNYIKKRNNHQPSFFFQLFWGWLQVKLNLAYHAMTVRSRA